MPLSDAPDIAMFEVKSLERTAIVVSSGQLVSVSCNFTLCRRKIRQLGQRQRREPKK